MRTAGVAGGTVGRVLNLDAAVARSAASGEVARLVIPVDGQDIEFYRTVSRARAKASSWRGSDQEGLYSVLLTIGADHLFGRVVGPDGVHVYRPGRAEFEIVEYRLDPSYEVELVNDFPDIDSRSIPGGAGPSAQAQTPALAVADDGSRIDVMILYTDGMADAYPGTQIDTRIQYLLDLGNQAFSNSGVGTQLNLVYSGQVSYPDDSVGDMQTALYNITLNSGVFAGLESLRTVYGADQVTLLRRFVDEGCGIGWLHTSSAPSAAYTVAQDGYKTDGSGYYCDDLTYIHEIGHNLGCAHDRANSSAAGWFDYSYGYQDPAGAFRTVMAYNCSSGCDRLTYFSTPDRSYNGKPLGVDSTSLDSADNARTIATTRSVMAQYRADVSKYDLWVSLSGVGTGSVTSSPAGISCGGDCAEQYQAGTQVTLTATADPGFIFQGWSGSCTGTADCTLTMDRDHAVTASFEYNKYDLTVSLSGTGAGVVTSSPAGISCGSDCAEQYVENTVVTLTPTPESDSIFKGWSGGCAGTGACTVTMDQDYSVGAEFAKKMVTAPITLLLLK